MPGDAIISIRPPFAEAILAGTKSVELRRRIPTLAIGTKLWIYSTRPTAAIVGSVLVGAVHRSSPDVVWMNFKAEAAISRSEFDAYFHGTHHAIAIALYDAKRTRQVDMETLKNFQQDFHPPQVLRHLRPAEAACLSKLARLPRRQN